jgi:hypothetical protein
MLIFVSCSQNLFDVNTKDAVDPQLLEFSKNPDSEAVFATMHMQLQQQGGFNRVLGLLNQLIHDGKKQLHVITKVWRRVNARCQVSKFMLKGRQEFFGVAFAAAQRRVRNARHRVAESQDFLKANRESVRVYKNFLNAEISRHKHTATKLARRHKLIVAAIDAIDRSIKEIKAWTPKGAALIQTTMKEVVAAFVEVQKFDLAIPTEFIQTAGSDAKVKNRLLQWFGILRVQFLGAKASNENKQKRSKKLANKIEAATARLIRDLKAANKSIKRVIAGGQESIKRQETLVALYGKMVAENKALIVANRNYCQHEAKTYATNKARIHAAIALFREIRKYFIDHYKRIHSYIRSKFE